MVRWDAQTAHTLDICWALLLWIEPCLQWHYRTCLPEIPEEISPHAAKLSTVSNWVNTSFCRTVQEHGTFVCHKGQLNFLMVTLKMWQKTDDFNSVLRKYINSRHPKYCPVSWSRHFNDSYRFLTMSSWSPVHFRTYVMPQIRDTTYKCSLKSNITDF